MVFGGRERSVQLVLTHDVQLKHHTTLEVTWLKGVIILVFPLKCVTALQFSIIKIGIYIYLFVFH